jgi:hypothetical protein
MCPDCYYLFPAGHFDVLHIGNPVALPAPKARFVPFSIEAGRRTTKERLIDAFERVDADNSVKMVVDPAGDDGHYAAPRARVELCGSGAECVLGYERGIFDHDLQSTAWIGSPHAAVLDAKRTRASTSRNFCGIRLPGEGERDVPAVAFTVDQHACDPVVAAPGALDSAAEAVRWNEGLGGTAASSNSLRLTRIAHRQHFPLMTIWFIPVDDAAAVLRVNSRVDRPMNVATVRYSSRLDSLKDCVEVVLAYAKTVVNDWKGVGPFIEVDASTHRSRKRERTALHPFPTMKPQVVRLTASPKPLCFGTAP